MSPLLLISILLVATLFSNFTIEASKTQLNAKNLRDNGYWSALKRRLPFFQTDLAEDTSNDDEPFYDVNSDDENDFYEVESNGEDEFYDGKSDVFNVSIGTSHTE